MRTIRYSLVALLVVSVLFLAACQKAPEATVNAAAGTPESSKGILDRVFKPKTITIPDGTPMHVRLIDAVGSARNRSGDTFVASLDEPIMVKDQLAVPRGANVTGRVTSAQPSGHLQTPAQLSITLTSVEVGGKSYEVRTTSYSRRAKSHAKRNLAWIGGTSAAGALIGALAGGGKGAAIGAGAGAGAGTGVAYATGKKDILLPSETRLRFVLEQPLAVRKG